MNWLSIDTDISEDPKIQRLIREGGPESYALWNLALTLVAREIDFRNERNGYLEIPGGKKPHEYLAFLFETPPEKCEQVFDICAELELISPEEWEKGEIFFPKLLERKQTKLYLKKQEGGQKGGKHGNKKRTPSRTPSGTGSGTPPRDVDVEEDVEIEEEKEENPSSSSSEEGASPPENQENDSWKGRAMGWIRSHKQIDDDPRLNGKKKPVINWFGKLIHGPLGRGEHGRDRTKWFIENCLDRVLTEARQAENKNEVYAHLYQLWNQQLQSELLEARVFRENEDSPESKVNEIDEMLESAFS